MRQERVLLYVKHIINYCCKIEFIKTELQQVMSNTHNISCIPIQYYYLGIDSTAAGNNIIIRVRASASITTLSPSPSY